MGITVTTNLGLIKPDQDEYIEENLPTYPGWADQNADNCDKIDSLFRHTSHTYAPSWTADVGNPTLGSGGFVEGKYMRIWPAMVAGYFRIFTGAAGFATGTGLYRLSLPVAMSPQLANFTDACIGKAYLLDADNVANSTTFNVMYDSGSNVLFFRKTDGDSWRSTAPITLAQGDRCNGYFMYPTNAS